MTAQAGNVGSDDTSEIRNAWAQWVALEVFAALRERGLRCIDEAAVIAVATEVLDDIALANELPVEKVDACPHGHRRGACPYGGWPGCEKGYRSPKGAEPNARKLRASLPTAWGTFTFDLSISRQRPREGRSP